MKTNLSFVEVRDKVRRTHTRNAGHFIIGGVSGNNAVNTVFSCGGILNSVFKIFPAENQSVGDSSLRNRDNRKKSSELVHHPVHFITPLFTDKIENIGYGSGGQKAADAFQISKLKNEKRVFGKRITLKENVQNDIGVNKNFYSRYFASLSSRICSRVISPASDNAPKSESASGVGCEKMAESASELGQRKTCLTPFLFLLLLFPAVINAQSAQSGADELQTLLQTAAVSYAQAASFVLEAADVTGFNKAGGQDAAHSAAQSAMRFAVEKKWLSAKADPQDAITLEALSLLIMKAFGLKGGPMYTLFGGAHYSYRELVFKNVIQGRTDPRMKVSGEKMLFIVGRLLYLTEENPWDLAGAEEAK
jgi:hypothetical protein